MLSVGVVGALGLGGLAMLVGQTPASAIAQSGLVVALVAVVVVAGVIFGGRDRPDDTPYW